MGRSFRTGFKFLLFLSSYIPLWIVFSISFYGSSLTVLGTTFPAVIIPIIILGASLVSILVFLYYLNTRNSEVFTIEGYSERTDILASYIVPYVFPFLQLDLLTLKGSLIFFVIMFSLMVVQIQSSRLYTNPFLSLLGFRILEADIEDRKGTNLLIVRSDNQERHGEVNVVKVSDNLLFEKGDGITGW